MYKILLADTDLISLAKNEFISYDVDIVYDTENLYTLTYKNKYDLYIANFYYYDAIEALKQAGDTTLTLFIDEYYDIYHLKKAFNIADDYIIKPLNSQELKIRVDYQFKKLYNIKKDIMAYGSMYFHFKSKQLYDNNQKVKLSPSELKLLEYFLCRISQPLTKDSILELLESSSDGTLRVYISKLNKLGFNISYERANFSYTLCEEKDENTTTRR
jgi:DNA-binding response OmpR family regulator